MTPPHSVTEHTNGGYNRRGTIPYHTKKLKLKLVQNFFTDADCGLCHELRT
jgi:hypothetical protein